MIQKGIIAQVIDKYNYKVRIPKYDKIESATYSTKLDDLSSGIVCSIPGIDIAYVEGDVVLVSFENDELSKPVILGLLYREEKKDSDILVKGVDESITDIKDDLDKLNSQSLFTHLKYSDDNGITFTSLFSSQNYESNIGSAVVCQPYFDDESTIGINIDKRTKAISWSILDENNQDITDTIEIETIVFDSNNNIIKREKGIDNRLLTINNSSKIDGELYLTYRIYTTKKYLDTLHVRLSTDMEPFGVRVGDYVGLYLSFDSTPSTTPADYTWFPIASGAAIDAEINSKIAKLAAEMTELLNEFKEEVDENFVTIFYRDVDWTQSEVETYCVPGYEGVWVRDPISGFMDEVKTGNTLYISVHNTGESSSSTSDDSYGQLQIRATADAAAGQDVQGTVIAYLISGEVAIDALARFKSSLLQPGDETLIYGGHITTGRIQDSSGKNFIQLSAEERAPAGQVEFKNQDTWAGSSQGLQWDSNQGQLNVKGNISASSLTIINGNDSYDGTAAINISGYDIEIEKNGIDEVEGVSVYLYPILYHNGVKVPIIDVDYSHFIWYQDNDTIGTEGDGENSGRYLATYGHNYRVVYDFDDGAVGGGTEVVDRTIDPSKYITKISDTGITIHPEVYNGSLDEEKSSRIQLDGTGMNLLDKNGNSIAQYGSTARVGLDNSSRFLMNNNSLQAYDNNNVKYFEVSSSGLTWGSQAAATTTQVSNLSSQVADAAKTATNYITNTAAGIEVHDTGDSDNYAKINSGGMQVYQDNNEVASFGPVTRIGTDVNGKSKIIISPDSFSAYTKDNFESLSITAITSNTDLIGTDILVDDNIKIAMDDSMASNTTTLDVSEIADDDYFTVTFTGWIEWYSPRHSGPERLFCEEENTFHKDGTTQAATAAIKMASGTDPTYDDDIGRRNVALSYDGEDTLTLTFTEASSTSYHRYYKCVVVPHVIAAAPITIPDIYLNGNVYLNSGEIGDTYQYSKFHGNIADFNEVSSSTFYTKFERTSYTGTTFNLGTVVCGGFVSQASSRVFFTIPMGRVFDYDPSDINVECILECDILIRAGNQAGGGAYIMKKSNGGADAVHLNGDYNAVVVGSTFYNMANQQKTLSSDNIETTLYGGTNVYVRLNGDPNNAGNIFLFSGNATNNDYINNQPIGVVCYNTKITLRKAFVLNGL